MRILFLSSLLLASITVFGEIATMSDYLGKCCPRVMAQSNLSEEDKAIIKAECTQFEARPENVRIGLKSCESPVLKAERDDAAAKRKMLEEKAAELATKKAALAERIATLKKDLAAKQTPKEEEPAEDTSVISSPFQYLNTCCVKDIGEDKMAICERSRKLHSARQQICERRAASGVQ